MATPNRTLRRGLTGEDVRDLQQLLRQAGYDPGELDGIFGLATEQAVKAFQRAAGLTVDGMAGPRTFAALTTAATPTTGTAQGRSLHIGLNHVDNSAYPQYRIPELRGCLNDAQDMETIARSHGFAPAHLYDAQATAAAVIDGISTAARDLGAGDIFLLTYSGHGSQVSDLDDDEADGKDETWVLYDRQLLDDELYALWGQFAPGVRVLMFSDSCHSGTMSRVIVTATEDEVERRDVMRGALAVNGDAPAASTPDTVQIAVELAASVRPTLAAVLGDAPGRALDQATGRVVAPVVERITRRAADRETSFEPRLLPPDRAEEDLRRRSTVYRAAKAMSRASVPPSAAVLLISGCQDNQVSMDGRRNGLFTQTLKLALMDNPATYTALYESIVSQMPATQTPNLSWVPDRDAMFEAQAPFTIG